MTALLGVLVTLAGIAILALLGWFRSYHREHKVLNCLQRTQTMVELVREVAARAKQPRIWSYSNEILDDIESTVLGLYAVGPRDERPPTPYDG
jgi:hypothetical protein